MCVWSLAVLQQEQEQEEAAEGAAQNETTEEKLPGSGSEDSDDEDSQVAFHYCFYFTLICTAINQKYVLIVYYFNVLFILVDLNHVLIKSHMLKAFSVMFVFWQRRRAGVEGLIEIENPNRVAQKSKKVAQIELDEPKQLSRRERCVFLQRASCKKNDRNESLWCEVAISSLPFFAR